jgi:hypothetical protein
MMACGAGTIYRIYFVPMGQMRRQSWLVPLEKGISCHPRGESGAVLVNYSQPALPQSWLQSVNQPQNWPVAPFESQPIPKPAGFVITLFRAVITNVGILHKKPIFDEFPFV